MSLEATASLDTAEWLDGVAQLKDRLFDVLERERACPHDAVWALRDILASILAQWATADEIDGELRALRGGIDDCRANPECERRVTWRPAEAAAD